MNNRDRAIDLLQHYIALACKSTELKLNCDNLVEIADIVDLIIAAVRDDLRRHP